MSDQYSVLLRCTETKHTSQKARDLILRADAVGIELVVDSDEETLAVVFIPRDKYSKLRKFLEIAENL